MNRIDYNRRTFSQIREELVTFISQNYPEVIADFTDSSVGSMLIDLNAAVGDNLSFNIDRSFQETQLEYAQQRRSILQIAKTNGLNITPRSASVTVVDFTINVPTLGDEPDDNYLPILKAGSQVIGNSRVFELTEDIDFQSALSNFGVPNRKIDPVYNANNQISSYNITKSEVVFNGQTKIFRRFIDATEAKPFFELTLPDNNVLSIEQIIVLDGQDFNNNPALQFFFDDQYRFYEVDYLAQDRIFEENYSGGDRTGIKSGITKFPSKKFIKEYTENGFCKITFGGGDPQVDYFNDFILNQNNLNNDEFLRNYLNNISTGEKVRPNTTIFVRYRTGGGSQSNLGPNSINQTANVNMFFGGSTNLTVENRVKNSLLVNNRIPAVGGTDLISNEQLKKLIIFNNASQNRCVTINDYLVQTFKMPGKFGKPFRANVFKENNKVIISVLGLDENGKLNNTSTSVLKENIAEYIKNYRMINDYVEVRDAKIINISINIDLYVQDFSDAEIVNNVVRIISNYFDINNSFLNEDIYIGDLINSINDATGVINVIGWKFFNKVGGNYSLNETSLPYVDNNTREIRLFNNTLYSESDSMFEIKFPEKDISVKLFRRGDI
jgi:hypothetical protein